MDLRKNDVNLYEHTEGLYNCECKTIAGANGSGREREHERQRQDRRSQ
jgi:hypothetical protein